MDRVRDWAVRCMHEAQSHGQNCFLTLTYRPSELPANYSIGSGVHQAFLKSLRHSVSPQKLRFFGCGEYGSEEGALPGQPHYHYLVFGWRPDDLELYTIKDGNRIYTSAHVEKVWPYGFSTVGDLTYESAAYVAGYCEKKIGGNKADGHYVREHPITHRIVSVEPERGWMSLKPGIGAEWLETFKNDVYPSDFCVVAGRTVPVPKFYVKKLAEEEIKKVKRSRKREANKHRADQTSARLRVREQVQLSRFNQLKRQFK